MPDDATNSGEGFAFAQAPPEDDAGAIARLARLAPLEYDRVREAEAKQMGVRVAVLDRLVEAARPKPDHATGGALVLREAEPWPEPVPLAQLLDEIERAVRRHVILSASTATLIALWAAHTWVAERFQHSPRLAITSPTARCGKSTLVELLRILCRRTLKADSISASGTFRLIEALAPLTLLLDESDTFLRDNEELRGVLDSGFERSGRVVRVVPVKDDWQPVAFRTFCPLAIAGIGKLPSTLDDRSLPAHLARKTAAETIHRLREPGCRAALASLARKLCRWAQDEGGELGADPAIPSVLNDREGDLSVPLLAIADAAGATWEGKTRAALLDAYGRNAEGNDRAETGVLLLGDAKAVFDGLSALRVTSDDLAVRLGEMEERPWPEWRHGRPMTKTQLAVALRPFGIRPTNLRQPNGRVAKGYNRASFEDAWGRYLGTDSPPNGQGGGSKPLHRYNADIDCNMSDFQPATATPRSELEIGIKCSVGNDCSDVAAQSLPTGTNGASDGWEGCL